MATVGHQNAERDRWAGYNKNADGTALSISGTTGGGSTKEPFTPGRTIGNVTDTSVGPDTQKPGAETPPAQTPPRPFEDSRLRLDAVRNLDPHRQSRPENTKPKTSLSPAKSPETVRKQENQMVKCKARPTDNRPKGGGGGSKSFVPWKGTKYGCD